jgi:hypothetical protein
MPIDIPIPKVRTVFARWVVECDLCGVIDSGIRHNSDATDIERKHRQMHITNAKRGIRNVR